MSDRLRYFLSVRYRTIGVPFGIRTVECFATEGT